LSSCGQQKGKTDNETTKEGNVSTTISTDTSKLSNLIDIKIFKPTHVKFKYTFIDNSGQSERLTVPGPSDNYLQAILYFDTLTFKNIKAKYYNGDYASPNFDKQSFNFDWLDQDIKNELIKSDTSYYGHPDYFLDGTNKLWLLENKLLLIKSTN
jgi:hypothetical protein